MSLTQSQQDILTLWYVVNTSLSSYYKLIDKFGSPAQALSAGSIAWQDLSIHKAHIARLEDKNCIKAFLYGVQENIDKQMYGVLFDLPDSLSYLYDPPPMLFYKGNKQRLFEKSLAIVGTRHPTEYAQKLSFDLAQYLVQAGFVVVSGLALGVDSEAHKGALAQVDNSLLGMTIGVMGTGIDVCYPKQNQGLFFDIIQSGGCLVTELLPATPASKHTFPRRNRLVTGLSQATIVTEAAIQSGSLISARLASEQGKQVFVVPGRIDTPSCEGCHHLIREGATLIYHPNQILEDLNSELVAPMPIFVPRQQHPKPAIAIKEEAEQEIPSHLEKIYQMLGSDYQDLDSLVIATGLQTGELLAQLMELEIYGLVSQLGGRYAKS